MSGRLPTWLADWLGLSDAAEGGAATWQLDSAWHWAPWVTVLLLIVAVAWTVALYAREQTAASRGYRALLAALRLSAIALLLVMIAQWAFALRLTGPPAIALLIDRSASMAIADRYADPELVSQLNERLGENGLNEATRLELAKLLLSENDGRWLNEFNGRYRLAVYFVDARIERTLEATDTSRVVDSVRELAADGPTSNATRIGDAVRAVLNDFRAAPPAAIVLLTDGVATEGLPLSGAADEARRAGVPLMIVGLGSPVPPQDIELADVLVDDVVFVDDVVSFQIQIKASSLEGQPAKISLRRIGATGSASAASIVAEQTVQLLVTGETLTTRLVDRPREAGKFKYVIEVEPRDDETNKENNRLLRTIVVSDEKIRVLLVGAYPSFEFRYLKSLLERDDTIQLATYLQDADPDFAEQDKTALRSFPLDREELFEYDVLILGDTDPRLLPRSVWQNVRAFVAEKGGGAAFLAGPRFFPRLYGDNQDVTALLPVELGTSPAGSEPPSDVNGGFSVRPTPIGLQSPPLQLGDTPAATEQIWQQFAPLYWLYEVDGLKPAAQVLAERSPSSDISSQQGGRGRAGGEPAENTAGGSLSLDPSRTPTPAANPVICFQYVGPGRVLFHAIDSTWRWRLGTSDAYFARYWVQTIRFLARGKLASGRDAQLTSDRREYRVGDTVQLRARFLDPRLAPSGDAVTVLIDSPGQARRRIALRRNPGGTGVFEASLVDLGEGQYEAVVGEPQLSGSPPSVRFRVIAPPGELARLEMDAAALSAAAEATRGKFYTIENAQQLLTGLPTGRREPIENLPPVSIWNRWWLLAAFVACITTEWVLRKRKGML